MNPLSWLTALPSLISGAFTTINGITKAISDEKIAGINAKTEEERIASNERVKTLEARRDLMVAEGGSRINAIVRAIAASPAIVVTWKLMVWDKVIGSLVGCSQAARGTCGVFTTDPLDDNQWKIIGVVYGFYFMCELGLGVARIIKR
jgi:hypothetical protein